MTRALLATAVLLATACEKGGAPAGDPIEASARPSPAASISASPGARPESYASDAAASAASPQSWSGTYKSEAGVLYVPDDWKVRWRPEEVEAGIGEGALTLSADAPPGAVRGTVDGPLGPAVIDGYLVNGNLSATITRSDARDRGFAGVLTGKVTGDHVAGTFNLSPPTGGAVRTGTFVLNQSAAPAAGAVEH
jgi:hypothetical protein